MKKHFLFVIVFLLIPFFAISQAKKQKKQITNQEIAHSNAKKNEKQDNEIKEGYIPKITLVASEKNINIYEVYNETIRIDLFYNKEKRDMLTNLPGFLELGVFSESAPIRVVIEEKYATEYLNKYFKSN